MWIRELLEYLAGERDLPPLNASSFQRSSLVTPLMWGVFLLIIYAFCGQSSRFIYIDF